MRVSRKWKTMNELNDYTVRLSGDEAELLVMALDLYLIAHPFNIAQCRLSKLLRDDLVRLRDKAGLW